MNGMNGHGMNGDAYGARAESSGGEEERERDDDDGVWKPSQYDAVTDYASEQVLESGDTAHTLQ